jgi:cytidylate kinase
MQTRPIVAIDGPAGAGKSTVAKRVAKELGFVLLDTGALYRAVALAAKRGGVDVKDGGRAGALAEDLARRSAIRLEPERVTLDGEDVSREIRTPDMGMDASTVSAHPAVRKALLDMQRKAGEDGGVVAEGRDIGTVVFPGAEHKMIITASAEVRAKRRYEELLAKGQKVSEEETLAEVKRRDAQDEGRVVAPLKPAPDAELINSSAMGIDSVVDLVLARVRARVR